MLIVSRLPGKTKGHFQETGPEGTVSGETFTCSHCNGIVMVDRQKRAHVCMECHAPVCDHPGCLSRCEPYEKKLAAIEKGIARQRFLSSVL